MPSAAIVDRAIRERVVLNRIKPGVQRDNAEKALDRGSGDWVLQQLERETAGLPPYGSKPTPRAARRAVDRGPKEPCPCGCGVSYVGGLTAERRAGILAHPHQRGIRTTNRRTVDA